MVMRAGMRLLSDLADVAGLVWQEVGRMSDRAMQMTVLVVLICAMTAALLELARQGGNTNSALTVGILALIGTAVAGLMALVNRSNGGGGSKSPPIP